MVLTLILGKGTLHFNKILVITDWLYFNVIKELRGKKTHLCIARFYRWFNHTVGGEKAKFIRVGVCRKSFQL